MRVAIGHQAGERFVIDALVQQPWAFDSNGTAVETHYEIQGGTLVQEVYTDDFTVYPVIADPTITFGWGIYVTYTNSEVDQLIPIVSINNFIAALCAYVPLPYGPVCAAIPGATGSSIYNTFVDAAANGDCVQMHYIPIPYPQLIGWYPVSC